MPVRPAALLHVHVIMAGLPPLGKSQGKLGFFQGRKFFGNFLSGQGIS